MQFLVGWAMIAVGFAAPAGAASGGPEPAAGAPGCTGLVVAYSNHYSGAGGASGNADASAGPGYFLGSDIAAAITAVRDHHC